MYSDSLNLADLVLLVSGSSLPFTSQSCENSWSLLREQVGRVIVLVIILSLLNLIYFFVRNYKDFWFPFASEFILYMDEKLKCVLYDTFDIKLFAIMNEAFSSWHKV